MTGAGVGAGAGGAAAVDAGTAETGATDRVDVEGDPVGSSRRLGPAARERSGSGEDCARSAVGLGIALVGPPRVGAGISLGGTTAIGVGGGVGGRIGAAGSVGAAGGVAATGLLSATIGEPAGVGAAGDAVVEGGAIGGIAAAPGCAGRGRCFAPHRGHSVASRSMKSRHCEQSRTSMRLGLGGASPLEGGGGIAAAGGAIGGAIGGNTGITTGSRVAMGDAGGAGGGAGRGRCFAPHRGHSVASRSMKSRHCEQSRTSMRLGLGGASPIAGGGGVAAAGGAIGGNTGIAAGSSVARGAAGGAGGCAGRGRCFAPHRGHSVASRSMNSRHCEQSRTSVRLGLGGASPIAGGGGVAAMTAARSAGARGAPRARASRWATGAGPAAAPGAGVASRRTEGTRSPRGR